MKTDFRKNVIYRIIMYILGLFVLAMGVAFSINSNLGTSPVSSLPYVISTLTSSTMSLWVPIIFGFYIVLQIIILRKNFKWINLAQIIFAFVFGYFTDFTQMILGDFTIADYMGSSPVLVYIGQLLMLIISIVLIGIGVSMYINAKLLPMPMEGLSLTIAQVTGVKFSTMKTIVDTVVVVVGIILSFIISGKLVGIREGTVIAAICVGFMVRFANPLVKKLYAPEGN